MHQQYLTKLLKLEGFVIEKIEENDTKILIYCHSRKRGMWYKDQFSTVTSTIRIKMAKHMIIEDRLVVLRIKQRKFYFSKYDKRLWEKLPNIGKKKRDTNIFKQNTLKNLRNTNYVGTAHNRFVSKMYPLRLLDEIDGFKINWDKDCKRLGLDGKGVGKYRAIGNITNLDKHEVISVLPEYNQKSLEKWAKQLTAEQRKQITQICVDMSDVPIAILKKYFPQAHLVVDHFHVIQLALRQLNCLRMEIQQVEKLNIPIKNELTKSIHKLTEPEYDKIKPYLDKYLELKCFWKTIHQLRKIYSQKDYRKARKQLRYVIWLCEQNRIPQMISLAKTLRNWFDEILNYYISKTTNAYTEGIHTRFELIKRNHFGIRNTDRFAKRLLFCLTPMAIFSDLLSNFVK